MRARVEARDPGVAAERTALSLNRSGLSAVLCAAILLRHVWPLRGARLELVLVLLSVSAIALVVAILAANGWESAHAPRLLSRRAGLLLAAGTVGLAFAGAALALLAPP